jgi:hypothetical protein
MNDHEIVKDKVGALNQVAGFVNSTERTDSQILKRIESLVVRSEKTNAYQATPMSNFFHRKTTGT